MSACHTSGLVGFLGIEPLEAFGACMHACVANLNCQCVFAVLTECAMLKSSNENETCSGMSMALIFFLQTKAISEKWFVYSEGVFTKVGGTV